MRPVRIEVNLMADRQQVLLALPGVHRETQRNDGLAEQKPAVPGRC